MSSFTLAQDLIQSRRILPDHICILPQLLQLLYALLMLLLGHSKLIVECVNSMLLLLLQLTALTPERLQLLCQQLLMAANLQSNEEQAHETSASMLKIHSCYFRAVLL